MKDKVSRLVNVRPGEWKLVFSMLSLLAINMMVLEVSEVVATTGFIASVGTAQVPWLWIADMFVILLSVGAYAAIVDRQPRVRLVSWLYAGFGLSYLVILSLFVSGISTWLNYFLLYLLADQQYILFPLAFWALANDLYTMSESKRLFPLIAAGTAIGSIMGNTVAAGAATVLGRPELSSVGLLALDGLMCVIGLIAVRLLFRARTIRARRSTSADGRGRETFRIGLDFVKKVPIFRYLAIAMFLAGLCLTIIEYNFLFTVDQVFGQDSARFQAFYGAYKVVTIVSTLLFQWLIAGRLLGKIGLKSAFLVLPASLVAAAGMALGLRGILGGVGGRFLARLVQRGLDEPSRRSLQGLIPDERRGSVSAFLDSYLYAVATLVGCAVLVVLAWLASSGKLPGEMVPLVYLLVGALAALGAVWAALRLRATYDVSMLNWRLARSRRRSVLDGIEF